MHQEKSNPFIGARQGPIQPSPLLDEFLELMAQCAGAFKQSRSGLRAVAFILGLLLVVGRKTCMASRRWRNLNGDESADYKIFNRSGWSVRDWFSVVISAVLPMTQSSKMFVVAMDDTGLRKFGKTIPQARFIHDPLALKWLKQRFTWGIRVLHLAALIEFDFSAGRPYAIPIGFYPKPAAKKPRGKLLDEHQMAAYQAAKKATLLTTEARKEVEYIRMILDNQGHHDRIMLMVVDGSFMNGSVARVPIPRVEFIGRVRATIHLRALYRGDQPRTFYGERLPTPEEFRKSPDIPWKKSILFTGGEPRLVKFKVIEEVFWKDGTGKRPMRLIIIAGSPYNPRNKRSNRNKRRKNKYFREHGYLLTTDLVSDPPYLAQQYLNRWQIEDTHRALKSGLGVGHPQNTSYLAVERVPSALVASYSLLMLAVLKVYGPNWDSKVVPQSSASRRKMLRRKAEGKSITRRFSRQDYLMLLRNEIEKAGLFARQARPKFAPKGWCLSPRDTFADR